MRPAAATIHRNEIRQIVEYARRRGMEIIPEIDLRDIHRASLPLIRIWLPSGKSAALVECGGIYRTILCAGKEETFFFS